MDDRYLLYLARPLSVEEGDISVSSDGIVVQVAVREGCMQARQWWNGVAGVW